VKHSRRLKRTAFGTMLLTSTVLLFMLAGTSLALTDPVFVHGANGENVIILRDANATAIPYDTTDLQYAFSARETCGACHDGTTMRPSNSETLLSYEDIEQHAYHAQLSANELVGWATFNANATGDFAKFRKCLAPKSKNWVQSVGHFGKW